LGSRKLKVWFAIRAGVIDLLRLTALCRLIC
jgi:hypothetical protein